VSFRRSLELRAGPALVLLARAPRWVPFALVLGCLVGGLLAHGVLAVLLIAVVLALLGLQLVFAWPVLDPAARLLRAAVLLLLAVAAVRRY